MSAGEEARADSGPICCENNDDQILRKDSLSQGAPIWSFTGKLTGKISILIMAGLFVWFVLVWFNGQGSFLPDVFILGRVQEPPTSEEFSVPFVNLILPQTLSSAENP